MSQLPRASMLIPLLRLARISCVRLLVGPTRRWLAVFVCCAVVVAVGCLRRDEPAEDALSLVHHTDREATSALDIAQESWPGWRGGSASGVAQTDDRLPVQWNSVSGIRWRVAIAGQGNSSPVVWEDRVFLTSGREVAGRVQLEVICLDRATGGRLWTNEPVLASGPTHLKNGYASATPATDGERLLVYFGSAGLFCFDLEGRQLWHAPLHSRQHEWGAASSPVLFGGLVIQVCDQRDEAFVAALDAATGDERWRTRRESNGGWSTPVIAAASRNGSVRHELVINGSGSNRGRGWVIAYDPSTGAELWRVRGTTDVVCPTPIAAGGLIISTSGRNGPVLAIRPGGAGDVTSSHVAWRHPRGGPYVPTGIALGNRLLLIRDEGALDCYDVTSGKRIWQERLRGKFTASLVAGDGKIYATSEEGVVYVIDAASTFKLLSANRFDERCLATPAVAAGELFVRTESQLYCIAGPAKSEIAASGGLSLSDGADDDTLLDASAEATPATAISLESSDRGHPPIHASPPRPARQRAE